MGHCRLLLVTFVTTLALAGRAGAQVRAAGDSASAAPPLFTARDGALAAGFAGLTLAVFPADQSIARRLQNPHIQSVSLYRNASTGLENVADPGSIVIGVSLYGVGRLAHWRNVEDLGLHGTEAVGISGVITGILKDAFGRSRPAVTADSSPHDFSFGRGLTKGSDYQSFPSGHTTAAFAAAAAFTSESQRWWPHHEWLVGPAMYGGATLVGLARMYHDRHWASDVALGAAIGTFTGLKVVRYSHEHPDNLIDRVLMSAQALPMPDGQLGVGFAFTTFTPR